MILTCGDALIDMVPVRRPGEAPSYRPMPGGSCLNIAVALSRLGQKAGYVGGISTDFLGDLLRETLVAEGVDIARASFRSEETTLGLVSLDEESPRYVFYDQTSAGRHWSPSPEALDFTGVSAVHFGSVTLIGDPAGAHCEAYAAEARRHCLVTLDPNCRPTLVRDADAYRARIDRIAASSDLVRLSDEDAAYLRPGAAPEALAQEWLRAGIGIVLLTHGADGATAHMRTQTVRVPALRVRVEDTIGAGDTFLAAFLARLAETGRLDRTGLAGLSAQELQAALGFAARAAAVTCTRAGANPPRSDEIDAASLVKA